MLVKFYDIIKLLNQSFLSFPGQPISPIRVDVDRSIKNGVSQEKSEAASSMGEGQISMTMMLVIVCLSVMSVLMLIILATWYIR